MARRGAHVPTDESRNLVQSLTAAGATQALVSRFMGLSLSTVRRHYRDELDLGGMKATALVAQSLFEKAISKTHPSALTAAIFWLKANPHSKRAGWGEVSAPADAPTNEQPATIEEANPFDGLPVDTVREIRELMKQGQLSIAAPNP